MGYNYNFINEENKDAAFCCQICQYVIKEATHGCKAHVFCKECIIEYINHSTRRPIKCPGGCEVDINPSQLLSSTYVDGLILDLKCKCQYCDWKGTLQNLKGNHESRCDNTPLKCRYEGCNQTIKRKDLQQHDNECLFKSTLCPHCNEMFVRRHMENHDNQCPKKKIQCPYANIGCQYQVTRGFMKNHTEESLNYHMTLSNQHFLNRISYLEKENNMLKEKNREVDALKEKIDDYEKEIDISNKKQEQLLFKITELKEENETILQTNKEHAEKVAEISEQLKFVHKFGLVDLQRFYDEKKQFFDEREITFSEDFNTVETDKNIIYFCDIRHKNSTFVNCIRENNVSRIVSQYVGAFPDLGEYEENLNLLMKIPTSFVFLNTEMGFTACINLQHGPVIELRSLKLVCLDDQKYKLIEKWKSIAKIHVIYKGNDLYFESKKYHMCTHVIDLNDLVERRNSMFVLPENYLIVMH